MAAGNRVTQLTQTQYDTLASSGQITVGSFTEFYSSDTLYLTDKEDWITIKLTSGVYTTDLKNDCYYLMEVVRQNSTYGAIISFGIVYLDSSANSSTAPVSVIGVDNTNSSYGYGQFVILKFYKNSSNYWYPSIVTSYNTSSFNGTTDFYLRFRRVTI